ncbi:ABC transporter substrate-binding protein [Xanthobacteraceae bacterium A53D]
MIKANKKLLVGAAVCVLSAGLVPASAQEAIKVGLSVPLSGAAANWGRGGEWLCHRAAQEIKEAGGVKVAGKTYNFECIAYDNKFNAADGAKVAQSLINKDRVKYVTHSVGTAPVRALQSLSERSGAVLFTTAWGKSVKGPSFPLTFTQMSTPPEVLPSLVRYVMKENPNIKTVVLLNPNDATGQDAAPVSRQVWESQGVKVLATDWYERGTTEFQPIAAKIAALKPDALDLSTAPPGEAGSILRELKTLGWNGVKVQGAGTGTDGLVTTGGQAADGTYLGAAIVFDGKLDTDKQKKLNEDARTALGESINGVQVGSYDALYALKAAMEKAQSIEPKAVAETLPAITFESFYGPAAFGGKETYGSPQQILIPVIISQVKDGKLVELDRVQPDELSKRLGK